MMEEDLEQENHEATEDHILENLAIEKLQAKIKELTDSNLRLYADMENLRKRMERERSEALKFGAFKFAQDLLAVADGFESAMQSIKKDTAHEAIVKGIELIEREFDHLFQKHGIVRFQDLHKPFDPERHDAVAQTDQGEGPENTIVQVIKSGYTMNDRLLRPAMVVVKQAKA